MTDKIRMMNLAISAAGLAICVLGLAQAIAARAMERQTRAYFVIFFSLLVAYVAANFTGQWTDDVTAQTTTLFLESAYSSYLTPLLTCFLLERSGEADWRRSRAFRAALLIELLYLVLLIFTQFSSVIYYFDSLGAYHRGPFYPALLVPPVGIMALNLNVLWSRRERYSRKERTAFAVYILLPMLTMLIQMLFFGVYVIVLGSSLAAMVMFLSIQSDQTERYVKKEAENALLQTEIMLSQIQPHFLYNSLAVIRDLCRTDPALAEEATVKFSKYLRGNMDSLRGKGAVPFERELEHTRGYLEIEQLRFEDKLSVVYDVQCTGFKIPTLTLQPIVENAVRYGVRKNADGRGTVTISTREYPDRYELTVADDGPGFDPSVPPKDDRRSHVGIQNVRERVKNLSGGTLTIASEPGRGTRATITLPKEAEHK